MFKMISAVLLASCIALSCSCKHIVAQKSSFEPDLAGGETLAASIPREALEKLANLTQDQDSADLWILIPSNLSDSQMHESNFALFKLNTGQLFNLGGEGLQFQTSEWPLHGNNDRTSSQQTRARAISGLQLAPVSREARKLNLFSNVLNKPKVSPLYLVNGTVCRFVNSQPICTTLSTTGLFRNPAQGFLTPQNPNQGFFSNGQQQNQQQLPNSRQVGPTQNNFSPIQQQQQQQGFQPQNLIPNQQQFRPAALMDDDTPAINVTNGSLTSRQQPLQKVNAVASTNVQPTYSVVNRRPLNLLSFARPFRTG